MTNKEAISNGLNWLHVEDEQFSRDVAIDFMPEIGKFYAFYCDFKDNEKVLEYKEVTQQEVLECLASDSHEHQYFDWLLVYIVDEWEAIGFIELGHEWLIF